MTGSLTSLEACAPAEPTSEAGAPCTLPSGGRGAWRGLVGYGVTLTACLLIMTWALQLWRAKLSVPLWFTGDALLHQAFIKGVADHGWHRDNGDLGAPWVLEVHDFPMPDHLHFLVQRLLSLLDPRPGVVFNL